MDLRTQIGEFEGHRNTAYQDHLGNWTIGKGHTGPEVCEGLVWSDELIEAVFVADLLEAARACDEAFPWFNSLNEPRKAVVIGMVFQMGLGGTLKFVNTLGHMRDERWPQAAGGMRASLWAKQTPKRVTRLAMQMETGEWQ